MRAFVIEVTSSERDWLHVGDEVLEATLVCLAAGGFYAMFSEHLQRRYRHGRYLLGIGCAASFVVALIVERIAVHDEARYLAVTPLAIYCGLIVLLGLAVGHFLWLNQI